MIRYRVCQTVRLGNEVEVSNRYTSTLEMALAIAGVNQDTPVDELPAGAIAGTKIGTSVVRLVYEEDILTPPLPARLTVVTTEKATA